MADEYDIDLFPHLKKSLGKARTDRIRYHQKGTGRRQACATNLTNTVRRHFEVLDPFEEHPDLDDILTGVARAVDGNTRPLNRARLFNIFQLMPVINTREIKLMMGVDDRQAQHYLRAVRMALPALVRHFTPARKSTEEAA